MFWFAVPSECALGEQVGVGPSHSLELVVKTGAPSSVLSLRRVWARHCLTQEWLVCAARIIPEKSWCP